MTRSIDRPTAHDVAADGHPAATGKARSERGPEPQVGEQRDRPSPPGRQIEPASERGPEPRIGVDRDHPPVDPPPLETLDDRFPGVWDRTQCPEPREVERHRPPADWVADRNPGFPDTPGRTRNCGECARASELTWRGIDTQAAVFANPQDPGESPAVMDLWSPGHRVATNFDGIRDRLEVLGPGSSALVAAYWRDGGGHWFNAFNHDGVVVAADGQAGRAEPWPPTSDVLEFEEADFSAVEAIFVEPNGTHLPRDDRR